MNYILFVSYCTLINTFCWQLFFSRGGDKLNFKEAFAPPLPSTGLYLDSILVFRVINWYLSTCERLSSHIGVPAVLNNKNIVSPQHILLFNYFHLVLSCENIFPHILLHNTHHQIILTNCLQLYTKYNIIIYLCIVPRKTNFVNVDVTVKNWNSSLQMW